jgi:ligand-binding sensor domain-containing protein
MKQFFIFILSFILLSKNSVAQSSLAIGQWKEHLPFHTGSYVTQSDDKVYYATRYALLIIDKADRALQRVTKVEGLSEAGVSLVKYNRKGKILLIVQNSGIIDLVSEKGILSLPNIPRSNIILGEKKIYDVFMANDSIAYIAGNFGVTTLNLHTGLFPNTIKTPVEVRGVQIFKGLIYIATPEGVYRADPAANYNLDDFSNWEWMSGTAGFPAVYESGALTLFNNKLYIAIEDGLFMFDGQTLQFVHTEPGSHIAYLSAEGRHLLAGWRSNTSGVASKVLIFDAENTVRNAGSLCVALPTYAVEDEQGTIWYADQGRGYRIETAGSNACELLDINSPYSINVREIATANNQVWIAAGGLDLTYSALFRTDGFFSLLDGKWDAYNLWNQGALSGISDFVDIKIHPDNGKIYAGAFLDALVEYDPVSKEFKVFNETNSTLDVSPSDPTRTRVAGIAFDKENNLWVCNNSAAKPVSVLKSDGNWQSFDLTCTPEKAVLDVTIDAFDYKWINFAFSTIGIAVFDQGNFDNPGDNRCKILNTSNSELPTNEVNVIEVDRDGAVWVGTKSGVVVFQCEPFSAECAGTRPFVEVDGFGANLLEDQDVRVIAIDGANRKWFGTSTGVFVMSPEGNEQIAHYTVDNSPLFDNNITDIAFNDETGEVYIGTLKGLISLRSDATAASGFHSKVYVFPNPVREDYDGPIAVEGLAEDATVKITDISGQLVFETEALGGRAIWNGRDYNGRKVNTGIYLVFATSRNASNPEVAVAKILLVN